MPKGKRDHLRVRISESYKRAIEGISTLPAKKYRKAKALYGQVRRTAYKLLPIIRKLFGKRKKRCVLGLTSLFHREAWKMALEAVNAIERYA